MLAGGFLTIGALVTALLASPAVGATGFQVRAAGAIALAVAAATGLCWIAVHSAPVGWHEGPSIDQLVRLFFNRHNSYPALLDHLIETFSDHHDRHEPIVRRVKFWVTLQAFTSFVATCVLIGAVLGVG